MEIRHTKLDGVLVLIPRQFRDARGFFTETWNRKTLLAAGLDFDFVQDNHSCSADAGTVRGLHYQSPPHGQDKLVRAVRGRIIDVAVDVRQGSPTYGRWISEELSAENGKQLFVPKGFLHGFATLEPNCEVFYKVTDYYAPECDGSVRFDDPSLNIDWQLGNIAPVFSDKDGRAGSFDTFISPFDFGAAK